MDWMFDQTFDGRRLWVLTIVDTRSRICPATRVCRSAAAMEAIAAPEEAGARFGLPQAIRVDQATQFTSREMDLRACASGITLDFGRPGTPTDDACAESFNAIVRMACGGQHCFMDLDDARRKVEDRRAEFDDVRPKDAIGDRGALR